VSWLSSAWSETAPVADVYERAILTLLAHRSRSDGTSAYPSVPSMARFAMCDERSIKRRLGALRRRGVIAYGDQLLAAHIDSRYRPKVYDLLIPASWYSAAQLEQVNRERAEQGLGPLTEADRPPISDPPPSRKGRSDVGVPRPRRLAPDEAEPQQSALGRQGGLGDTSAHTDPGVSRSPAQG
jgi:hypothetical protein